MRWPKVTVVATAEFTSAVRTKAFVASVLMLPLIYGAAILIQLFASRADTRTRTFALIDRTTVLAPAILEAAKAHNDEDVRDEHGKQVRPRFEPEPIPAEAASGPDVLVRLSDRVRSGELFAFVEIPADVLEPGSGGSSRLRYHTNTPTDLDLPRWLEGVVNTSVHRIRLERAGLDPVKVTAAMAPVLTDTLGLVERPAPSPAAGTAAAPSSARKIDPIRTVALPIALVFVMFVTITSTTPQLMQTVLEEKMSKITEVLLGSVTPFELMLGKLLGNVGVALVLAGLYLGTAYAVSVRYGYGDLAQPGLMLAVVLFIVLGVTLFGSLFMAVGSACSDLKDAQSLMLPVLILAMLPAFFWSVVLQGPDSPVSVAASLFPPATPFLMLMRMALTPAPPVWQVALSVALTTLTALACVWAAGKIFRTGILMQGKAPGFFELARWIVAR
ncbi:MAG: sodium transporter [Isosphaeraceae bacterium]|jgi:ABC-type Na+ efflux pump permease subunit|nr:MAG: sodium transporter [Isosphaeraceae bacterium]